MSPFAQLDTNAPIVKQANPLRALIGAGAAGLGMIGLPFLLGGNKKPQPAQNQSVPGALGRKVDPATNDWMSGVFGSPPVQK